MLAVSGDSMFYPSYIDLGKAARELFTKGYSKYILSLPTRAPLPLVLWKLDLHSTSFRVSRLVGLKLGNPHRGTDLIFLTNGLDWIIIPWAHYRPDSSPADGTPKCGAGWEGGRKYGEMCH